MNGTWRRTTPRQDRRAILLPALVGLFLLLAGCQDGENRFLDELTRMEEGSAYGEGAPSEERIQELRGQIEEYRGIVEEKVEAAGQLGTYHKMLGVAYMDQRMYGLALEQFEAAISIQPENPILFYYAGVSAARMAKSTVDDQEEAELYTDAEEYYLRSVELDPGYHRANYALGVLYVFELDRPVEARPYLERIIEDQQQNTRARMVLARSYAVTGEVERATEIYDEVVEVATDQDLRDAALRNRDALLQGRRQ